MNGDAWTKERDTQLRKLREAGLTFSQIAAALAVTRSAVAGKVRKMGLTGPADARPKYPKRQITAMPIPATMRDVSMPVTLFDLEPHHCRWLVSDAPYLFCADAKQDGSSYCERHFGISRRGVTAGP